MILQRKPKMSLFQLMESITWETAHEVVAQTKPLTPPPTHTSQLVPEDKKRKRDQKGKDVVEEGRGIPPPPKETEPRKGLN